MDTSIPDRADSVSAPPLVASGLTCVRAGRRLFSDLSVALAAGEVLQVEGPNGSGKTTLLRAICGLAPLESGAVAWRGLTVAESGAAFHADLSYIGHTPAVKLDLTPIENLRVALALGAGRPRTDPAAALRRLGLSGLEHTPLRRLSAGQCRRVALARLLVAPTHLWVLDEPFTALDAAGKHLVEGMITEHCGSGGQVMVSTHQPLELGSIPVQPLRLGA